MRAFPSIPARSRREQGIVLWLGLGLMVVLTIGAWMLAYMARYEEVSSVQVARSEQITAMGEAVLEELILKVNSQLNINDSTNKIYYDVRDSTAKDITIDKVYLRKLATASRAMITKEFGIPDKDIAIKGWISHIQPFKVKGFEDASVLDPVEKNGQIDLQVGIRWLDRQNSVDKTVFLSRPFKVVKCVMPVFAECTLFDNNSNPDYFAQWPSLYGYNPAKYPDAQPSLVCDNGWHGYARENKKSDFIKHMEEEVLVTGKVPPGRIFINKGIVPLTNGDRASGALQKTFFSAESELLPDQLQMPLKALKQRLAQEGFVPGPEPSPRASASPAPGPSSSPPSPATTNPQAAAVPEQGELFVRWVGHGQELKEKQSNMGGKTVDSYGSYFASLIQSTWNDAKFDPQYSGLDLFGHVTEKQKGQAFSGNGIWGKIVGFFKKVADDVMSKLYTQYDIRLSPTLVYGNVIETYFGVIDYMETGWWQKMKNTFSFNDNQVPLPYWPEHFLERYDPDTPIAKVEQLPSEWDTKIKSKWIKLPDDMRKPRFYTTLQKTFLSQPSYLLGNDFLARIPPGAFYAPFNTALMDFLKPDPNSRIRTYFSAMSSHGAWFLSNEADMAMQAPGGCFWKIFNRPLTDFNPFLFYVKATDYVSSIVDPRNPKESIFWNKYYNKKDDCYEFNGVIYITGTEDLLLGKAHWRGKAIIITFGRVIFNGYFTRTDDSNKPDDPTKNSNLTIVSLGGVWFDTSERVDAQIYSYIYPPQATPGHPINVYGALGCNQLDLSKLPDGGTVVYDYTYHIDPNARGKDRDPYYYVSITNELAKYDFWVQRDVTVFDDKSGTEPSQ